MVHETIHIGFVIIFGVVLVPVYAMLVAWFIEQPRDLRRSVLGVGYLMGFIIILLVGTWVAGMLFRIIMPI